MNLSFDTVLALFVGGLTNGAIYALLGLGLVLIYGVTRVINIAQGEFVTLGALTTVSLLGGRLPASFELALVAGVVWVVWEAWRRLALWPALGTSLVALASGGTVWFSLHRLLDGVKLPYLVAALAALALVGFIGAAFYRFLVQPVPEGSEGLVYLIITTGAFIALEGFALVVWGSQGSNLPRVSPGGLEVGLGAATLRVPNQNLFVLGSVAALLAGLYLYFERTVPGKALRATAINRLGARIVGISPVRSGLVAWSLSAVIGALAGVLIGPIIIVNYDTGLPLGLKGFIGAVIGGLTSYPGAVLGGLFVGVLESFAGYFNSSLREVIVYSLLFVILVARSVRVTRRPRPALKPSGEAA